MTLRGALLLLLLGAPAVGLLAFGPRGRVDAPRERTIIHYWEKWTGVEGRAMQRIVERFNKTVGAERNIWVQYVPVSNVDQRTLIATAGGDPPDVAGLFDHIVPQFAARDALMPLDELVREFDVDLDAFKLIWLDIGRVDGKLFALPSTPFTIALYYNRRLFREAQLDPDHPPRTIAELDEYARKLTKRDADGRITQLGFTTSPAMLGWWHWVWPCFFDARLWDNGRFTLDSPEGIAAAKWIASRRAAYGVDDLLAFEATAGAIEGTQNPFLSERLAMVFQGPWVANWIRAYAPDLDYGVAPFPSASADRRNVFASTDVFVIPRGSRHPREAMTFLAYMMRRGVLEDLCKSHGKVSPFREPSPDFFVNHPNPYIRVFDRMALSPDAFGYPAMPTWSQATSELLVMLDSLLRDKATPEDAVRTAQSKVNAIVTEYEAMAAQRRGRD